MISKYSISRSTKENMIFGSLTSFTAGMVNVSSFLIFFSFSSNVTGYYAILAAEIIKGNLYQVAVVFAWIFLFFLGSFTSNLIIINLNQKRTYLAHALPLLLEILCLAAVGFYGEFFYKETLSETEILLSLMLYAMGIQNGFTASTSNFAIKTTHLTGTTTDMGIIFSMFTQKQFRENEELKTRAQLLICITAFYLLGAIVSGLVHEYLEFKMFYLICFVLFIVAIYDSSKIRITKYIRATRITGVPVRSN